MAAQVSSIRPLVKESHIEEGLSDLAIKLSKRLEQKGGGAYASRHEAFGILAEEVDEVIDELRDNSMEGYDNFAKELLDVAVAAIFSYICVRYGYIRTNK